jgi:hypothetical protein
LQQLRQAGAGGLAPVVRGVNAAPATTRAQLAHQQDGLRWQAGGLQLGAGQPVAHRLALYAVQAQ